MKNVQINHTFTLREILLKIREDGYNTYMKVRGTKAQGYDVMGDKLNEFLDMIE